MDSQKQKVYHPGIDILRIISILAVVGIHTTSRALEASSFALATAPVTFFLNQAARFAVPLFFMISGFVLELNYSFHGNFLRYIKKRLGRIAIPYIVWSAIYFFFVYKEHTINFFYALATGDASYQLYFIPTLLIFYLIFPLLHKYYTFFARWWAFILLGIIQVVLLFYDYTDHPDSYFYPASIALLNFYPFLLGIVASHHQQKLTTLVRRWKYVFFIVTLFLAGYITFEGMHGYFQTHNYQSFYSQWRPSILLYTILIGLLLFYISSKEILHKKGIKLLARLSFFVFFVHVIILETVWNIFGKRLFYATHNPFQQVWYDVFFFMIVASISFLLALFFEKIPGVKRLTS